MTADPLGIAPPLKLGDTPRVRLRAGRIRSSVTLAPPAARSSLSPQRDRSTRSFAFLDPALDVVQVEAHIAPEMHAGYSARARRLQDPRLRHVEPLAELRRVEEMIGHRSCPETADEVP